MDKIHWLRDIKSDCCGCTACEEICAQHAIHMEKDEEGFYYPVCDDGLCISCGQCEAVCPFLHVDNIDRRPLKRYAAKYNDDDVRMASTSGAAYTALSDYVLEQDGIIYGSVFDSAWNVHYTGINNKEQRDQSRGVKYVQSCLGSTFQHVREDLTDGRWVMFIGPACYVAGLQRYLAVSGMGMPEKLITVDMVCHGVPSPGVWKDNVAFLKEKFQEDWEAYYFRDKSVNWRGAHNMLVTENREIRDTRDLNAFTSLYFDELISRPSCYHCKYAGLTRPGDITIGDCWGIEQVHPDFDDGKGISLIMINTDKGHQILENVGQHFLMLQLEEGECMQPQLIKPPTPSAKRKDFWNLYREKGYQTCIRKFTSYGNVNLIKQKIKKLFKG